MNILLLATGGTIGSTKSANGLAPKEQNELLLLQYYKEKYPNKAIHFDTKSLCSILSENADDAFYEILFSYFSKADFTKYAGIILLHGTDTLSFTAPLLAMLFGYLQKPICLVSSNHILEGKNANGLLNFHAAVRYIESGCLGFVVPYQNHDGRMLYHLATRIMEADAFLDDFQSAQALPLAELKDNHICFLQDEKLPIQKAIKQKQYRKIALTSFENEVLFLKLYPNFPFELISLEDERIKAILFSAYHSGTAPQTELAAFIKRAKEKGIDVYLSPLKRDAMQYASTTALLKAGVQPLYSMTNEAALAKLKLAYNQNDMSIEAFLQENLYFEEI